MMRRFELHRDAGGEDVPGSGLVGEGVQFTNGLGETASVAVQWSVDEWPQSIVFHKQGVDEVLETYNVRARVVWLDD